MIIHPIVCLFLYRSLVHNLDRCPVNVSEAKLTNLDIRCQKSRPKTPFWVELYSGFVSIVIARSWSRPKIRLWWLLTSTVQNL